MEKQDLNAKIETLMKEWAEYCHAKWPEAVFVKDGPFPFYKEQTKKILFIGRELPGKINKGEEGSCIDYRDERFGMNRLGLFQRRLLYLAYGIKNGEYTFDDWSRMPEAEILDKFFAEDAKNFSYAFMNASKILNTEGTKIGNTFYDFINDEENQKYFLREIEILDPDIIISGNLGDIGFMGKLMPHGKIKQSTEQLNNNNRFIYTFENKIPWIDTWHFSAPKAHFEGFYEPICAAAKVLLGH